MPVYNTGDPRVDQAFGNLASIFAPDPRREIAIRQSIADMHYKNAQRHAIEQKMLFENYLLGERQKVGGDLTSALQAMYGNLPPDMASVLGRTYGIRDGNVEQAATGLGTLSSIAALLGGGQDEDDQRRAMALRGQMADNNTRMTTGYDTKVRGDDRSHDWRKHGATISATNARHAAGLRSAEQIAAADREAENLRTFYAPATLNPGQTRVGVLPGAEYSVTSPVPDLSTFDPGEGVMAAGADGARTVREADPAAAAAASGKAAPGPNGLAGYAARLGLQLQEGNSSDAMDYNVLMVHAALRARGEPIPAWLEQQAVLSAHRMNGGGLTMVDNGDGTKTLHQTQGSLPPGFGPVGQAPGTAEAPPAESGMNAPAPEVVEDNPAPEVVGDNPAGLEGQVQVGPVTEVSRGPQAGGGPLRPGDTISTGKPAKAPSVEAGRMSALFGSFDRAVQATNSLFGYDPQTGELSQRGYRPGAGTFALDMMFSPETRQFLRGTAGDSEGLEYETLRFSVTEPLLRFRSGAATPDQEVIRYYANLMPGPGNPPDQVRARLATLNAENQLMQNLLAKYGLSLEDLSDPTDPRVTAARDEFNARAPINGWDPGTATATVDPPQKGGDNIVQRARQVLEASRRGQ